MSCCCSDEGACVKTVRFIGWSLVIAAGVAVVAMLPEIKRYIKISSM
jgi:hypothetical protein